MSDLARRLDMLTSVDGQQRLAGLVSVIGCTPDELLTELNRLRTLVATIGERAAIEQFAVEVGIGEAELLAVIERLTEVSEADQHDRNDSA